MEVHRQQCQSCLSYKVHDVLVREAGQPQTVYVICANCHELVARYRLQNYYHHGKGAESFMRSREGKGADSARELLEEFDRTKHDAHDGYARVLKILAEQHKALDASGYPTEQDATKAAESDD
ncbi:MAG: hypothetical protein RIB60_01255 [Phycisphaerales bacterium]